MTESRVPKGPKGEKRPADLIGAAVKIMKIATGEIEESPDDGKEYARRGGHKGGRARAKLRQCPGFLLVERQTLYCHAGESRHK